MNFHFDIKNKKMLEDNGGGEYNYNMNLIIIFILFNIIILNNMKCVH